MDCINPTHSIWLVCGNISTACNFFKTYPFSENNFISLANVEGLQEIYTTSFKLSSATLSIIEASKPFLGGSNIIVSIFWLLFISLTSSFSTAPFINSIFSIPFSLAVFSPSSLADFTISIA